MVASLLTLPLELILLIFELGPLKIGDAVMLRSLCRELFDITESRIFWLCVAELHERDCPFPIPPSCPRGSMKIEELKKACFKAYSTIQNIASAMPVHRNHRTLDMRDSANPIGALAIVPGGRYVIVAQQGGLVGIWDLDAENNHSLLVDRTSSASQHPSPQRSYMCLATYNSHSSIHAMHIMVSGDHSQVVTVAADGTLGMYSEVINVFTFTFVTPDQVEVEERFRTEAASDRIDAMDMSNSLVAIVSDQGLLGRRMELMLIEYWTGRFINVTTTIDDGYGRCYDVVLTQNGHVLLCKSIPTCLVISAYFDVSTTLFSSIDLPDETHSPDDSPQPIQMSIPPHSTIRLPYASSFPDDRRWITTHRWPNTSYRSRVAIITQLEDPEGYYMSQEQLLDFNLITMHWVSIDQAIGMLRAPYLETPTIHRAFSHLRYSQSPDAAPIPIEREILTFGTFVRTAIWLLEIEGGGKTLEILPLPGPSDDEKDESYQSSLEGLVRKLHFPSTLGCISDLDFCDTSGTLVVSLEAKRALHIFNY